MTKTCETRMPKLLSVKNAAEVLGVHYRQLLGAVNDGSVPHYKLKNSRKLMNVQEVLKIMNPAFKKEA